MFPNVECRLLVFGFVTPIGFPLFFPIIFRFGLLRLTTKLAIHVSFRAYVKYLHIVSYSIVFYDKDGQ